MQQLCDNIKTQGKNLNPNNRELKKNLKMHQIKNERFNGIESSNEKDDVREEIYKKLKIEDNKSLSIPVKEIKFKHPKRKNSQHYQFENKLKHSHNDKNKSNQLKIQIKGPFNKKVLDIIEIQQGYMLKNCQENLNTASSLFDLKKHDDLKKPYYFKFFNSFNSKKNDLDKLNEQYRNEIRISDGHKITPKKSKYARTCTCNKTQCLKLYCPCFKYNSYCNEDCNCKNCLNTRENKIKIKKAQKQAILRNPLAFKSKSGSVNVQDRSSYLVQSSGCKCQKSQCQQKYCECFARGMECGNLCQCKNCKNISLKSFEKIDEHPLFYHQHHDFSPPKTTKLNIQRLNKIKHIEKLSKNIEIVIKEKSTLNMYNGQKVKLKKKIRFLNSFLSTLEVSSISKQSSQKSNTSTQNNQNPQYLFNEDSYRKHQEIVQSHSSINKVLFSSPQFKSNDFKNLQK